MMAGVDLVHVPYRGGAPALADLRRTGNGSNLLPEIRRWNGASRERAITMAHLLVWWFDACDVSGSFATGLDGFRGPRLTDLLLRRRRYRTNANALRTCLCRSSRTSSLSPMVSMRASPRQQSGAVRQSKWTIRTGGEPNWTSAPERRYECGATISSLPRVLVANLDQLECTRSSMRPRAFLSARR